MKFKLIISLLFLLYMSSNYAQVANVEINSNNLNKMDKKGRKNGWWVIHADSTLTPTSAKNSATKYYVYFANGKEFNHPVYFIKDSLEKSKIKKKYQGYKFTDIDIRKGNWGLDFANGEYEFIRYKLGDSSKFWNVTVHFKNGKVTYQKTESHREKNKIYLIESDYTKKYEDYPLSFIKKFPLPRGKNRELKFENYNYIKNGKLKTKAKEVNEYTF